MKRLFGIIFIGIVSLLSVSICCTIPRGEPVSLYSVTKVKRNPLKQCSPPLLYMINEDVPEKIRPIIIRSFEYWDNLTDKRLFFNMGETDWFVDDMQSGIIVVIGISELKKVDHNDTLAYASLRWYETGCIFRGGIEIYKEAIDSEKRLESVMRHEIGHLLGLGHSPHSEDLMYKAISIFDGLKDLSKWELNAFNVYYNGVGVE